MSILVKGIEMPKSCKWMVGNQKKSCPFSDDYDQCMFTGEYTTFSYNRRDKECPLVEIPSNHGRLIDADRMDLQSELFTYTRYTGIDETPYEDATKAIFEAPTVVPSEKEVTE
jgi:hypothetical protein